MCKMKNVSVGIKDMDFRTYRGKMVVRLLDLSNQKSRITVAWSHATERLFMMKRLGKEKYIIYNSLIINNICYCIISVAICWR